jgi:hypothetical protein
MTPPSEDLSRLHMEIPIKAAYSYLSASIGFNRDAFKKWEEFAATCASRHAGNRLNTIPSGL